MSSDNGSPKLGPALSLRAKGTFQMKLIQRLCTAVLVVLLSAILPTAAIPQARAYPRIPVTTPIDNFLTAPRHTVDVLTYVCRVAKYNLAFAQTMDIMWGNFSIPTARRTAMLNAAERFATEGCGPSPVRAKDAFNAMLTASDQLTSAYANMAGISKLQAQQLLLDVQTSLISDVMTCGNAAENVQGFLLGMSSGPINLVGQPVSGPPLTVAPLTTSFSCGGGGGGGGGGTGAGRGLGFNMNASGLASCMAQANKLTESCPITNPEPGSDAAAKAKAAIEAAAAAEAAKNKVIVTKVSSTGGSKSVTLEAQDGSSVTINQTPHDNSDAWIDVAFSVAGVIGSIAAIVAVGASAPAWAAVGAAVGLTIASIQLARSIAAAVNAPKYDTDVKINPRKLCPAQVGSQITWWVNPAGDPLTVGDAFSFCSCASAIGTRPESCRGQGQAYADRNVQCAMAPYSTPGEHELCTDILMTQHPELDRGKAAASMCGYKDCGAFAAPMYSAGTDACGCSTSGGTSGGIWLPEFGWTDPYPIPTDLTP
jgi:hypothetical protein